MALRISRYQERDYPLSYEILHPQKETTILFLHGWGSDKELMRQAFGKLLPDWRHLYLDLPGFGKSPNESFLSTEDYAAIIEAFLRDMELVPEVVVGHSFGGKVATLLDPPLLVLLSSAGIPVPKALWVRLKIALFKTLKPFGLAKVRDFFVSSDAKGMNPGMYETFKATVNEDFSEHFSRYEGKGLLFWGEEDTATPLWTGMRVAELMKEATLHPMEGDHYFFLRNPSNALQIAQEIESTLKKSSASPRVS